MLVTWSDDDYDDEDDDYDDYDDEDDDYSDEYDDYDYEDDYYDYEDDDGVFANLVWQKNMAPLNRGVIKS